MVIHMQTAERPTLSAAASKKIGAAGLLDRLILFVFFLCLPLLPGVE